LWFREGVFEIVTFKLRNKGLEDRHDEVVRQRISFSAHPWREGLGTDPVCSESIIKEVESS
jgi:hypothetical protein